MTAEGNIELSPRMLAIAGGILAAFFLGVGFVGTQFLPFETKADAQQIAKTAAADIDARINLESQTRATLQLNQAADENRIAALETWRTDQSERYGELQAKMDDIGKQLDQLNAELQNRRR